MPDSGNETQTTSIIGIDCDRGGIDVGVWDVPGVLRASAGTANVKRSRLCSNRKQLRRINALLIRSRCRIDADDNGGDDQQAYCRLKPNPGSGCPSGAHVFFQDNKGLTSLHFVHRDPSQSRIGSANSGVILLLWMSVPGVHACT